MFCLYSPTRIFFTIIIIIRSECKNKRRTCEWKKESRDIQRICQTSYPQTCYPNVITTIHTTPKLMYRNFELLFLYARLRNVFYRYNDAYRIHQRQNKKNLKIKNMWISLFFFFFCFVNFCKWLSFAKIYFLGTMVYSWNHLSYIVQFFSFLKLKMIC